MATGSPYYDRSLAPQRERGSSQAGVIELSKDIIQELVHGSQGKSLMEKTRVVVQDKGPQLQKAVQRLSSDMVNRMREAGFWKGSFLATVGLIASITAGGLGTFATFLLTATTAASLFSFVVSLSIVGVVMAFFLTSLGTTFLGVVGVAGFVISSIVVIAIGVTLFAAGWIAFGWCIWQAVAKTLQFVRGCIAMLGSALASASASANTQVITVDHRPKI